jgi:selenocysteine-specific elongation factor
MFELLSSAHPLKHRAPVHFHAGTAEVEAEARLLQSVEPMKPGSTAPVRFLLRDPLLLLPDDRFIVRMFSPVVTIGGGVVAAINTPSRLRRPAIASRTIAMAAATPSERIRLLVEESAHGLSVTDLIATTGMPMESARNDWVTSPAWTARMLADVQTTLAAFHQANPLLPGMTKEALRAAVLPGAPAFLLDDLLTGVIVDGDIVRLRSHRVALRHDDEVDVARLEALFANAGLAVPALTDALTQSKLDPARARTLLQILLKNRRLVRVNPDLVVHSTATDTLRAMIGSRKGSRFSVGEFKEWTGVSRKYAIPLLEWLDRERVTRREGEQRVVL